MRLLAVLTLTLTPAILRLVDLALEEDLGRGDVTSEVCVDENALLEAVAIAREPLVVSGLDLVATVFARVDPRCVVRSLTGEGDAVAAGQVIAEVQGPAWSVLGAERTALNFLQRLCGIATLSRRYAESCRAAGGATKVCDTRKTTPGFRVLEKRAVRAGGCTNHRADLASGLLIKDNHLVACGGIRAAVAAARAGAPHALRVEVEVTSLGELREAIDAGVDVVLLDNFDDATLGEAVAQARRGRPAPIVEISGGVTLERIPLLARLGVDFISVGAITHGARAVDIALEARWASPRSGG